MLILYVPTRGNYVAETEIVLEEESMLIKGKSGELLFIFAWYIKTRSVHPIDVVNSSN